MKLDPKFGVNPSIDSCFWCGKDKDIILFGASYKENGKTVEAPRNVVSNYEPCLDCEKTFKQGIHFIECSEEFIDNRLPLKTDKGRKVYPTGRWCVANRNYFPNLTEGTILTDITTFTELFTKKAGEDNEY